MLRVQVGANLQDANRLATLAKRRGAGGDLSCFLAPRGVRTLCPKDVRTVRLLLLCCLGKSVVTEPDDDFKHRVSLGGNAPAMGLR